MIRAAIAISLSIALFAAYAVHGHKVAAIKYAALQCPEIENHRIANVSINNPDGSITCEYYRPFGAGTIKAKVR